MNQRSLTTIGVVLGVLILSFFVYRNVAEGRKEAPPPSLQVEKASDIEKELQQIKIVASAGELIEAKREDEGWIIAAEDKVDEVSPYQVFERSRVFFRNLRATNVPVKRGTFTLKTDTIRDDWGHPKRDETIMRVVFGKESFAKVHWSAIDPFNIRLVADEIFLHESVMEQIQKREQMKNETPGSGGGGGGGGSGGGGEGGGGGGGASGQ